MKKSRVAGAVPPPGIHHPENSNSTTDEERFWAEAKFSDGIERIITEALS